MDNPETTKSADTKTPSSMRSNVLFGIIVIAVFGIAYFAGMYVVDERKETVKEGDKAYTSKSKEVILSYEHILHEGTSPITVIEYIDLECSHCQKFYLVKEKWLVENDPNITLILRHFPLVDIHKGALSKAVISECVAIHAGEEQFQLFIDAYFKTENTSVGTTTFAELAEKYMPDDVTIDSCLSASDARNRVGQSIKQGLFSGVYSTPSFVILRDGIFETRYDLLTDTSAIQILEALK